MKRRKVLLSVMILALVLVLTLGLLVACNDDQKTQYTVTFKDGDTEVATVRVDEGKALTAEQIPAGPDHNGEEFDGWYLDDQVIEAGYTPTADVTVTAKYHTVTPPPPATQYKVSFDPGDGTGTKSDVLADEGDYTLPTAVGFTAPSGLEFYGWESDVEGDDTLYKAGDTFDLHAEVTFTAQWNKKVTYKFVLGDEYTGSTVLPDVTQFASDVLVMPSVTDWADHYINIWTGYYNYDMDSKDGTYATAARPGADYTQLGQFADITWVADWKEAEAVYTVSYWINGVKTDKSLPSGSYIITNAPSYTVPADSYFVDWFYATDDGTPTANPVQSSAQVSEDCSIVAVFESYGTAVQSIEEKFRGTFIGQYSTDYETVNIALVIGENSVSFRENGDVYTTSDYSLTAGSTIYLTADGAYIVDLTMTTNFGSNNEKFIITFVDATHLTIARLSEKANAHSVEKPAVQSSYNVTYYSGMLSGLPGTQPEATTAAPGSTVTTLATCPWTRAGWDFIGWKVQTQDPIDDSNWIDMPEYTELSAGDTFVMPESDVRITARWKEAIVNLTVKYMANGGNGEMDDTVITYGDRLTLEACTFTPADADHVFGGWAFSTDGDAVLEDGESMGSGVYESYAQQEEDGNYTLTLYAVWEDAPFWEYEEVMGKWTGDGHELIIIPGTYRFQFTIDIDDETGESMTYTTACAVIFDGQYFEMVDMYGMLVGTSQYFEIPGDYDSALHYTMIIVMKSEDGNIQVNVQVGHADESTDYEQEEDSNDTYNLNTRTPVDFDNPSLDQFVGTYENADGTTMTIEIVQMQGQDDSEPYDALQIECTDSEELDCSPYGYLVIGDYLILIDYNYDAFEMDETVYTYMLAYVYTLKKDGDNLVGKYYVVDDVLESAGQVEDVTFTKSGPTPPPTSDSFTFTGSVEASDMDENSGTITKIVLDSTTAPTTITVTVDGADETFTGSDIHVLNDINGWYIILSNYLTINFAIEGDTLTLYFDEDGDYSYELGTLTLQA